MKIRDVENKIPLIDPNVTIHTSFDDCWKHYRNIIKFGPTSYGKEFLPYFDGQDVDLLDSSALSGLELFYYYTDGFGGFIKPRISVINFYNGLEDIYRIPFEKIQVHLKNTTNTYNFVNDYCK